MTDGYPQEPTPSARVEVTYLPAQLPAGRFEVTLASLTDGDEVYITPWTMLVDMDGACWLNLQATFSQWSGGTVNTLLRKDRYGWHVDLSRSDFHYRRTADIPPQKRTWDDIVPVRSITE